MSIRTFVAHNVFLLARDYLIRRGERPGVYGDVAAEREEAFRALDRGDLPAARRLLMSLKKRPRGIEEDLVRLDLLLRPNRRETFPNAIPVGSVYSVHKTPQGLKPRGEEISSPEAEVGVGSPNTRDRRGRIEHL